MKYKNIVIVCLSVMVFGFLQAAESHRNMPSTKPVISKSSIFQKDYYTLHTKSTFLWSGIHLNLIPLLIPS